MIVKLYNTRLNGFIFKRAKLLLREHLYKLPISNCAINMGQLFFYSMWHQKAPPFTYSMALADPPKGGRGVVEDDLECV